MYYTGTILKESVPYAILLLTHRNGQYSSYFSITTDSGSASLPTGTFFLFIIFLLPRCEVLLFLHFLFSFLLHICFSFLHILASFQHSRFSDILVLLFFPSLHFHFYFLAFLHFFSTFTIPFFAGSRSLLCILCSNSLPSKMYCRLGMKRGKGMRQEEAETSIRDM